MMFILLLKSSCIAHCSFSHDYWHFIFHCSFVDMLNVISTCRDILCVDINVDKRCVDHSTSYRYTNLFPKILLKVQEKKNPKISSQETMFKNQHHTFSPWFSTVGVKTSNRTANCRLTCVVSIVLEVIPHKTVIRILSGMNTELISMVWIILYIYVSINTTNQHEFDSRTLEDSPPF